MAIGVTGVVGVGPALWCFGYVASMFLTLHKRLCLTFLLSNNLLVLDASVDRRTDRIKRNLGNQSVGD